MRILVLDEGFPYPLDSGKRIRTYYLTRELAREFEVSYLAYATPEHPAIEVLRGLGVQCHPVAPCDLRQHGPRFYLRLGLNLLSPLPYIVTSHTTRRFAARPSALLAGDAFDLVVCEWTPYANFLRQHRHVPSIIVAHNLEGRIWRRYESVERNPARRAYISVQRKKVERFERECFSWASGATAVSADEAQGIRDLGVAYPVEVIDNGVDTEHFHVANLPAIPNRMVFCAAFDWRPNQDAAAHFVEDILPLIRGRIPDAHVVFVGRQPPRHLVELGNRPGVTVTGTVPDVRPYVASASLCVVPLRIGGGSRLKILEAMAMRVPVLSTTIGAEGLEVTPGSDILIADGSRDFAERAIRALGHPHETAAIARAGRELVERRYQWPILGERLREYVRRIDQG
jgi:polysaccharide biosynthesis protein PslH